MVNLVVFESLFEEYRREILGSKLLMVEGYVQREGPVLHVIVKKCYDVKRLVSESIHLSECEALRQGEKIPFTAQNQRTQMRETANIETGKPACPQGHAYAGPGSHPDGWTVYGDIYAARVKAWN